MFRNNKFYLGVGALLLVASGIFLTFKLSSTNNPSPTKDTTISTRQLFDEYTDTLFFSQLSGDSLSRHFYISDWDSFLTNHVESQSQIYSDYSIDMDSFSNLPQSLGSLSYNEMQESQSYYISQINYMKTFNYDELSLSQQQTYDILMENYKTELDFGDLCLCYEILNPTTGFQAQLPVLLSEYQFVTDKDVENYLELLSTMPTYFSQILEFENLKWEQDSFMNSDICRDVIEQCQAFIGDKNPKSSLLATTFNSRIEECSFLSSQEISDYKEQNLLAISNYVFPSYESLINGLTQILKASNGTASTLATIHNGGDYYEYLVASLTGSSKTVTELEAMIQNKVSSDLTEIAGLITEHPELQLQLDDVSSQTADSPENLLAKLKNNLAKTLGFDSVSNTTSGSYASLPSYSIKYVDASLEDFLSPAFYLTPEIDRPDHNTIYINGSSRYANQNLYATLAHEALPGHMYQNYIFSNTNPSLIRHLLNVGGYTEGWATYVELLSYETLYDDSDLGKVLSLDSSFSLGIYCLVDIGVNYKGWTLEDASVFLQNYGISNETSAKSIYSAVMESPANYLQYYVGYLEILELRDYYLNTRSGSTLGDFHAYFLEFGPAPFDILKKWVPA